MPYEMVERPDGWAIVNSVTKAVAEVNDVSQTGLDIEEADDLVDLLNLMEAEKPIRLS